MPSSTHFIVMAGLEVGEKVVSQGGFLLDSEAQLQQVGHRH